MLKSQKLWVGHKRAECVQDTILTGKDLLRDNLLRENDFKKFVIHSFRNGMW